MVDWVNHQPLAAVVTSLRDGHDGIWNIIDQIATPRTRDSRVGITWWKISTRWVAPSIALNRQKLSSGKDRLMQRSSLFADCRHKQAQNFCQYLDKHRRRIVNYEYFQAKQICSIGDCALSVQWNLPSNKLSGASKFQEHSGTKRMCPKCWLIAVLTSMAC